MKKLFLTAITQPTEVLLNTSFCLFLSSCFHTIKAFGWSLPRYYLNDLNSNIDMKCILVLQNVFNFGFQLIIRKLNPAKFDSNGQSFAIFRGQSQIKSNQAHINKIMWQYEIIGKKLSCINSANSSSTTKVTLLKALMNTKLIWNIWKLPLLNWKLKKEEIKSK
jgi:hypothetical protein